jgi:hypothetical protein
MNKRNQYNKIEIKLSDNNNQKYDLEYVYHYDIEFQHLTVQVLMLLQ